MTVTIVPSPTASDTWPPVLFSPQYRGVNILFGPQYLFCLVVFLFSYSSTESSELRYSSTESSELGAARSCSELQAARPRPTAQARDSSSLTHWPSTSARRARVGSDAPREGKAGKIASCLAGSRTRILRESLPHYPSYKIEQAFVACIQEAAYS